MDIGILRIGGDECLSFNQIDLDRVSYELSKHGYFVRLSLSVCDPQKVGDMFAFLCENAEAVLVCGKTDVFYEAVRAKYDLSITLSTFVLQDTAVAVSATPTPAFIEKTLLPMLNAECKTFYATSVFRTVGKTEAQLRDALKDRIKNRNRISFRFVPEPFGCAVLVRYSNKTQKATVEEMLGGVTEALRDCTYAYEDITLPKRVTQLLLAQNKTLGVAESFTGGAIASSLVHFPGVSESFKESVVCYSNEVKRRRLHITPETIEAHGAVSIETAYEMAVGLLMDGGYDYVVATTGNAGPTSEKPGEVGLCYIAVGDRENVHIYRYIFTGDRDEVIASGVQASLFRLYKLIMGEAED